MYSVAKSIAQPYCALLLIAAWGLLLLARHNPVNWRRFALPWAGWLGLALLSIPIVSQYVCRTLETGFPSPRQLPTQVDALVVLGGGLQLPDQFLVSSVVTSGTLRRCISAAEVYRRCGDIPIICCGGPTLDGYLKLSEAEAMRDCLVQMQVPAERIILEKKSRNTRENAMYALEILQRNSLQDVALITSARHMNRAVSCFKAIGVDVLPLPCNQRLNSVPATSLRSWIPSARALSAANSAIQEWLGIVWYKLRGWT
ncbi:MAG: YdcF family protein [Planctomycetota bacterium]|nr:YdcF family protein [Planctomycetota bacterium]